MTAVCTLCGAIFQALPYLDISSLAERNQKQFADIGRLAGEHLNKKHRKTIQTRFPEVGLVGPIPVPALVVAVGMCAQNAAVSSYLRTDDPVFTELHEKLVMVVRRSIEPVADVKPALTIAG